jgi:hypothetical protein
MERYVPNVAGVRALLALDGITSAGGGYAVDVLGTFRNPIHAEQQ